MAGRRRAGSGLALLALAALAAASGPAPLPASAQPASACGSWDVPFPLSNGTEVQGQLDGDRDCLFVLEVPPGQNALVVRQGNPTAATRSTKVTFDARPTYMDDPCAQTTSTATCEWPFPKPGHWWILVHNVQGAGAFTLQATHSRGTSCGSPTAPFWLHNGTPVEGRFPGEAGSCYFALDVPEGQIDLLVEETSATAARALSVAFDAPPQSQSSTCGREGGGTLACDLLDPQRGRWWMRVENKAASPEPFTIRATHSAGSNCGSLAAPRALQSGVGAQGRFAGVSAGTCHFVLDVPPGQAELRVTQSNPTGAKRLLGVNWERVREPWGGHECLKGSTSTADCRIANPAAGRWWITVQNEAALPEPFTVNATYAASAMQAASEAAAGWPSHDPPLPGPAASLQESPGASAWDLQTLAALATIAGTVIAVVALFRHWDR